jgi:hypothetical protein
MKKLIAIAMNVFAAALAFAQAPPPAGPVAPVITWSAPVQLRSPAPLTALQLNASANTTGTFVYTPAAGTVLPVGDNQITVTFTPDDSEHFTTATATVNVKVVPTYWPYDPIEPAFVCHVNADMTPIMDQATGRPRCFVVPVPVSQAITKYMITQTNGLNADGSVSYKYASWWDLIVKHFISTLVNPMLDQYPPDGVAAAKANADAALKAVDAAKAALLQGQ